MVRLALAAPFLSDATPALADDAGDRGCAATTAIVTNAVALRTGGADQGAALASIEAGNLNTKYPAAVSPLLG
jgi:hypothetical protein